MDKLWAILPIAICVGIHFFMMRGHGGHSKDTDEKLGYDGDMYTCPMHPEVKKDKPGSCPKCGMTLVKAK